MNRTEAPPGERRRSRAALPTRYLVRGSLPALVLAVLIAVAAAWSSAAGRPQPPAAPLPVPGKPSIPAGGTLYATDCARCHADTSRFRQASWRANWTPADVARTVLGRLDGHPDAVTDLSAAWAVTGYVWTLPDDSARIRLGERLAFEADATLRSRSLSVLLFHWSELQDLKSGDWVLNHDEAAVDRLMRSLGGSSYTSLSTSDRRALIAYVFASYFVWPANW